MASGRSLQAYKVLATRCGSCGCGCPTVLEADNQDEVVIVGRLDAQVLASEAVKMHVGKDEIAVVLPKDLLVEAAKKLG